jgi:hypothetical protein
MSPTTLINATGDIETPTPDPTPTSDPEPAPPETDTPSQEGPAVADPSAPDQVSAQVVAHPVYGHALIAVQNPFPEPIEISVNGRSVWRG